VTIPYTGPAAAALGNVDYSLFVGLPVSAVVYLILARGIDLAKEAELAKAEGNLSAKH
jgi:hypothetical protein